MEILNKDEFNIRKKELLLKIKHGAVFIYPTDTIYGIGGNALRQETVHKIREIKDRYTRPFSVIAPSVEWIKENCKMSHDSEMWLKKLPGPYTLILKLKNKGAIDIDVNSDMGTVGIRIPDHWCKDIATELNIPIITTSANITTKEFMTSSQDLDMGIRNKTEFMIDEGELKGHPSTLIDLTKEEVNIKERKK
jgi:L-threonylcarbamoyladenylate synthase